MADTKIADLTALTSVATNDVVPIVDVSDTTDSSAGTTKKITQSDLVADRAPLASPTFTGTVTIPANPIIGSTTVTATGTEMNTLVGVTSAVQTQLNNRQPLDSDLTTIAGLADPNADRMLFWDDSAGAYAYLAAGTGLSITGTTISTTVAAGLDGTSGQYKTFLTVGFDNADYTCDGADDHVQIQAALDALPATGGVVFIKSSATAYDIGSSIVLDSYQYLIGAGTNAVILKAKNSLNSDVITTSTASGDTHRHMYVAHLKIDGNRGGNTAGRGIYCYNARNSTFYDLWITETDEEAIYLSGDANLGWFNMIDRCEVDLCDAGFHMRFCEHNWITRNTMSFIIGKGIFCESDLDFILDNQLDYIEDYEIHLYFGAGIWTVSRNSIDRPQSDGIVIEGADKCLVNDNYFDSAPAGKAHIVNNSSDQMLVTGNRMTQSGGAGSYGIRETSATDKCMYTGNMITGPTTAITLNASSTNVIRNNNQGD